MCDAYRQNFTTFSRTDNWILRMAAELGRGGFKLERLAHKPTPQRGPRQLFVQVLIDFMAKTEPNLSWSQNKEPLCWARSLSVL